VLINSLESGPNDMANKLPDRIKEPADLLEQFLAIISDAPEQSEIALFQNIRDINNLHNSFVLHLGWNQETLAQDKIRVGQVGERFQKDRLGYVDIH
jgi:hypothetical protein